MAANNNEVRQAILNSLNQNANAMATLTPEQFAQIRNHYASLTSQSQFTPPMLAMPGQASHQQFNSVFAQQLQAAAQAAQLMYPQAMAMQQVPTSATQPQQPIRSYPYPVPNGVQHPTPNVNQQAIAQQQQALQQRNQHHQRRGSQQHHQQQLENSQQISLTFTTAQGTTTLKAPKTARAPFPPPNPQIAQLVLQNSLQQYLVNNPHLARRVSVPGIEKEILFFHPAAMVSILTNVLEEFDALFRSWAQFHGYPNVLYSLPFMSPTTPQMREATEHFIRRIMVADELQQRDYTSRENGEAVVNGQQPGANHELPVANGQSQVHINIPGNAAADDIEPAEGRLVIASPSRAPEGISPSRNEIIRELSKATISTAILQMPKGVKRISEATQEDGEEIKRACHEVTQQITLLETKLAEERTRQFGYTTPQNYLEAGSSSRPMDFSYYTRQQEAANTAAVLTAEVACGSSQNPSSLFAAYQRQMQAQAQATAATFSSGIATPISISTAASIVGLVPNPVNSGQNGTAGGNTNEAPVNVPKTKVSPIKDPVSALVSVATALETNKITQQARITEGTALPTTSSLPMSLAGVPGTSGIVYRPYDPSKRTPSEVTAAEALMKMPDKKLIRATTARDYNTGPYAFPMGNQVVIGKNGQKNHKCNVACPPNCPGKPQ